ncbi:hypothetical protein GC209_07650 [bacterium]|nr:hypothetical protein [bacterium]
MLHLVLNALALAGALALPVASMANDASGFPSQQPDQVDGAAVWSGARLILAQYTGGTDGTGGQGYGGGEKSDHEGSGHMPVAGPVPMAPDADGISPEATAALVAALNAGTEFCQNLRNPAYNVDCLSYEYWQSAQALPKTGGYADARKALLDAAEKLHNLAVANRDRSQPAARGRVGKTSTSRPLTPVRDVAAVNAQAAVIVHDTNLVLLRSSSGSNQRRLAYSQIAAVVNSTKVLLRSS